MQQLPVCFQRKTPGNHRSEGVWPTLFEDAKITNGAFKGRPVGVDRAQGHLVLEHHLAHDQVRINRQVAELVAGKVERAGELSRRLDREMAESLDKVKAYTDKPRVAVIHFGRASNVYMVVGKRGQGDAAGAGQMIEWAGGEMAIDAEGMQRMASPEMVASKWSDKRPSGACNRPVRNMK